MKQITIKRAVEAWYWIHNNAHHSVYLEWPKNMPERDKRVENSSHITLANYHERIRIPDALRMEVWEGITPNKRKFDTRMFALKARAKSMVSHGLR